MTDSVITTVEHVAEVDVPPRIMSKHCSHATLMALTAPIYTGAKCPDLMTKRFVSGAEVPESGWGCYRKLRLISSFPKECRGY